MEVININRETSITFEGENFVKLQEQKKIFYESIIDSTNYHHYLHYYLSAVSKFISFIDNVCIRNKIMNYTTDEGRRYMIEDMNVNFLNYCEQKSILSTNSGDNKPIKIWRIVNLFVMYPHVKILDWFKTRNIKVEHDISELRYGIWLLETDVLEIIQWYIKNGIRITNREKILYEASNMEYYEVLDSLKNSNIKFKRIKCPIKLTTKCYFWWINSNLNIDWTKEVLFYIITSGKKEVLELLISKNMNIQINEREIISYINSKNIVKKEMIECCIYLLKINKISSLDLWNKCWCRENSI